MAEQTDSGALAYQKESMAARLGRLFRSRTTTLFLLTLAISAVLAVLSPQFLTQTNLTNVFMGMTYDLLMASGMTLVLVTAGIDLSVGAVLGLTGVVTTLLLQQGVPTGFAIVIGLTLASLCGAVNGFLVARVRLAPFIVTLGMMSVARGIATVLTSGYFVSSLPEEYLQIGQGTLLGIPYPVLIVIPILLVFDYLIRNWNPLKQAFYVGNNEAAARFSGINVMKIVFFVYVINGLLAGTAAVFMTSRLAMGFFQFGLGAELTAIAASVIGGASLLGGSGSILGTFFGVLLLAIINNGFVLLNGSPNWLSVVSGAILVVAVAVDAYRRRKETRE